METISSYIYLDGLRFHAYHGVLPQERLTGNDYIVDCRCKYDITKALLSDDVNDTLNYAEVFKVIAEEMDVPSKLIERVCGRIATRLFDQFPAIDAIDLKMSKVTPPMGADCNGAGVEIHLNNNKTK